MRAQQAVPVGAVVEVAGNCLHLPFWLLWRPVRRHRRFTLNVVEGSRHERPRRRCWLLFLWHRDTVALRRLNLWCCCSCRYRLYLRYWRRRLFYFFYFVYFTYLCLFYRHVTSIGRHSYAKVT